MLPILEKSLEQGSTMTLIEEQKIRELDDLIDKVRETLQIPLAQLNQALTEESRESNQLFNLIQQKIAHAIVITPLLASGIAIFIAFLLARTISSPLNAAVAVSKQVATGNLITDIQATSNDETGQLLQAMKTMVMQLKNIVADVSQSTTQVHSTAAEITQDSVDLAQRLEKQAAALQQTAASMEQLTATVKQSADNAGHANQLASAARHHAEQGGQVVDQAIAAMNAIHQSSQQIADIIGVIDGIAFQTNLLALNAAVEAARAGEQGRGFAVVAGEVRKLAHRSAEAAKEIKGLIANSVSKVEDGGRLAECSGQTLREIVVSVKKVSDIVAAMATATREQATGIEQINQAILQMDQVTQQNAALVEQTATASQSMGIQAQHLQQAIGFFTLGPVTPALAATVRPHHAMATQEFQSKGTGSNRQSIQNKAVLIAWSNALSVNDPDIDQQHQQLIRMINDLHHAMRTGQTESVMGNLFNRLVGYTVEHFSYEEGRMAACRYPNLSAHKEKHADLVQQVTALQERFAGGNQHINTKVMRFLKDWITNHIQKSDQHYAPYLQSQTQNSSLGLPDRVDAA